MNRLLVSACALLCACAFAQEVGASSNVIPLEQFTRPDEFGTIKISPDGEVLALTTGKYGRSALAFFDVKQAKMVGGFRLPDHYQIDDFDWVSSTRLIYKIAQRYAGYNRPIPTGEMFAINRDGTQNKLIYGYRAGQKQTGTHLAARQASYGTAELISALKNDPDHILIAEYPWRQIGMRMGHDPDAKPTIARLNVRTGKKRSVGSAPVGGAQLLVDRNEEVRFAIGVDEHFRLTVGFKAQPDAPWQAFELAGFREESVQPRQFSTDNRSVLFTGVREGETLSTLYRLDLETREVEKLYAFENSDIDDLVTDFAGREIVGVRGYPDRPRYHWLVKDDPAARLYMGLERAFPNQSVTITSTSDDGRLAIAFVSSDTNPGDYYLFDTQAKKADYLRSARAWIDPRQMRPKEPISLTVRDGLVLHGYLTRPAGDGPHPLIVLPHGGPYWVRDTWSFEWDVQLLANRGYAVLQVNFRGSGGYGMDFTGAGFREWGGRMQDDLTDATHWAIEQKITQPDRICIFGGSYGGYAALMGAVREPKLYRCAIGLAGVYDLELMLSRGDIPTSRRGRSYLHQALGNDPADLKSRSPTHNVQRIEIPVLLVHGKEDGRADYEHAKLMKSVLEKHDKQFEWLALSREGHGIYDEELRLEVYEQILAFLNRNLMQASPTAAQ